MITRRNLMKTTLAGSAVLAMPWVARAAAQSIRFAHAANEIHPGHKIATSFAEALEELVPGAMSDCEALVVPGCAGRPSMASVGPSTKF